MRKTTREYIVRAAQDLTIAAVLVIILGPAVAVIILEPITVLFVLGLIGGTFGVLYFLVHDRESGAIGRWIGRGK